MASFRSLARRLCRPPETAPGIDASTVLGATEVELVVAPDVKPMTLD